MPFRSRVKVRFNHADRAGIVFYGNYLTLAHHVLEEFVEAVGFTWDEWFANPSWGTPFRKVEVDYRKPHLPGRDLDAEFWLEDLSNASITSRYRFFNGEGDLVSEIRAVNVFMDYRTLTKVPMPESVRARLESQVERVPEITE